MPKRLLTGKLTRQIHIWKADQSRLVSRWLGVTFVYYVSQTAAITISVTSVAVATLYISFECFEFGVKCRNALHK